MKFLESKKMRLLYLLTCLLLSSCVVQKAEHTHTASKPPAVFKQNTQDGAPTGVIPVSFKKIVPQNEPISRYGNPESYQVEGRKYNVLKDSLGYKTRGIASWYGTKFHSKRTSSGDEYDMYAMTAAHKTLPLPSYLRVKNLANGRVIIVKVNDRGPFRHDRIIDLSYAAASTLGLLPKGTAPVEIEALKTGQKRAHYYIQAGAFSTLDVANKLKNKLTQLTSSPVRVEKYQQHYIVRVGPFADKRNSDHLKAILISHGISGAFSLLA